MAHQERSTSHRAYHPRGGQEKLAPETVYEAEVEVWPASIVHPASYRMALTIGNTDFERAETPGLIKGSGLSLHNDPADRPAHELAGTRQIRTSGRYQSYLLLPVIRS